MTNVAIAELDPHSVDLSTVEFTAEQFDRVCEANPDRSFELTAQGVLVIMPPVGVESGNYESELLGDLVIWNRQTRLGKTFSSSTVFTLPNGDPLTLSGGDVLPGFTLDLISIWA